MPHTFRRVEWIEMSGFMKFLLLVALLCGGYWLYNDVLPGFRGNSEIIETIQSSAVRPMGGMLQRHQFGDPEYYVLYFSASWCGACHRFTPELIRFYQEMRGRGVEVVLVGRDRTQAEMISYMLQHNIPFPALEQPGAQIPAIERLAGRGIPQVVVLDRHGRVIDSSTRGMRYVGPSAPLKTLTQELRSGSG